MSWEALLFIILSTTVAEPVEDMSDVLGCEDVGNHRPTLLLQTIICRMERDAGCLVEYISQKDGVSCQLDGWLFSISE